jgi:hypothetical protein
MKTLSMGTGLVAALITPLLLAGPSGPPTQEGAAEGNYMTLFSKGVLLEGKSRYEAAQLLQRVNSYFSAHYSGTHRFHFFAAQFNDDGWYLFYEFDNFDHFLAVKSEWESDDGRRALMQECVEIFGPFDSTHLYPLNGVGIGDGEGLRVMKVTRSYDSKIPQARRFARRVATHMSAEYEDLQVRTFSADDHDPGAIYWCFDYTGSNVNTAWESIRLRLLDDDEYIQMHEEAEGLFIDVETPWVYMS